MLNRGTDLCFTVDEDYFNTLILNVYWQRPSLFNFSTPHYAYGHLNPCIGLEFPFRPYQTLEPPLVVPGTNGRLGLDFTLNIEPPRIAFYPYAPVLSPDPAPPQSFSLSGAATLGMPHLDVTQPTEGCRNTISLTTMTCQRPRSSRFRLIQQPRPSAGDSVSR